MVIVSDGRGFVNCLFFWMGADQYAVENVFWCLLRVVRNTY
jgi:hypothetical protein